MTMAKPTGDDDLADELEATLRIKGLSDGPPPDSTEVVDTSLFEAESKPFSVSSSQQPSNDSNDYSGVTDDSNGQKKKNMIENNNDKSSHNCNNQYTILCDMAYGMPREPRPRKEKIRAIARQLVNFLSWQQQQQQSFCSSSLMTSSRAAAVTLETSIEQQKPLLLQQRPAQVKIVGCADSLIEQSLKDRMLELWLEEQQVQAAAATATTGSSTATKSAIMDLPSNLTFTHQSLESFLATTTRTEGGNISRHTTKDEEEEDDDSNTGCQNDIKVISGNASQKQQQEVIYLSPDAKVVLDPALRPPPSMIVVGLLIDRKQIQMDRSLKRAQALQIPAVRWPLEKIVLVPAEDDDNCSTENDDKKSATTTMATTITNNISMHASEPLNCDCILEGMQQWYWNYDKWWYQTQCSAGGHNDVDSDDNDDKKKAIAVAREVCFSDAVLQALQHHVKRHPRRPIHKTGC